MEYYLVVQKMLSKNYNEYRSLWLKLYYRRAGDNISELALHELHWLPIKVRTDFKIITIMDQVLSNASSPAYLKNLICHSTHIGVAGNLRSNANNDELLVIPYVKCKTLAWRSFSVAGPILWNNLPSEITTINDTQMFKEALQNHLFCKYYYS